MDPKHMILDGVAIPADLADVIRVHRDLFHGFTMGPDPLTVIQRIGTDNPPTDAELKAATSDLKSALDLATKADEVDLELARDLRKAIDTANAETTVREEAAAKAREELAALRVGVFDDEAEKAETEPADAEQPEKAEKAEAPAEPVAASATADLVARLRERAARVQVTEPVTREPGVTLKALGPAAGFDLGENAGFGALGAMFSTHGRSTQSGTNTLVQLRRHFEESRTLGSNVDQNNQRIASLMGPDQRPVIASGGLCGPGEVDHSHPICSTRGRPIRDALPSFNASRGTITYAPAASVGLLAGAVSIWTAATDANPGAAVKPCPPIPCPEEVSATVDAVTRCITVGNFQAKFSPEFWASRLELLLIEHDRIAEQKAIDEIDAASTPLTDVAGTNVLTNFLSTINRVVAYDESVHRNLSGRYRMIADAWLRDALRNQVIANLGVANNVDQIQIADAEIARWLSAKRVDPVWTADGTLTDTVGTRNILANANAFNPQARLYIHPVESFLFLDGGTLDLGTEIRDSTLNATNDRQAFAETFEKVALRGCSAYKVDIATGTECGCPAPVTP